jgi:hypothetical protein
MFCWHFSSPKTTWVSIIKRCILVIGDCNQVSSMLGMCYRMNSSDVPAPHAAQDKGIKSAHSTSLGLIKPHQSHLTAVLVASLSLITNVNLLIVSKDDTLEYSSYKRPCSLSLSATETQAVPCKACFVILSNTSLKTFRKWCVCMFDEHLCLEVIDNRDQSCAISRLTRVIKSIWWSSCKDWTAF